MSDYRVIIHTGFDVEATEIVSGINLPIPRVGDEIYFWDSVSKDEVVASVKSVTHQHILGCGGKFQNPNILVFCPTRGGYERD